jgi:hypothetical protein
MSDALSGLRRGRQVWATPDAEPVQIAWEWTEIQPDVVALFDPMKILSNVALVDGRGHALVASRRMLHLNNVIHRLDWRSALHATSQRPTETPSCYENVAL